MNKDFNEIMAAVDNWAADRPGLTHEGLVELTAALSKKLQALAAERKISPRKASPPPGAEPITEERSNRIAEGMAQCHNG